MGSGIDEASCSYRAVILTNEEIFYLGEPGPQGSGEAGEGFGMDVVPYALQPSVARSKGHQKCDHP